MMFLIGFLPSLVVVFFVDNTIGINDGAFETGKYVGPATGFLETGTLGEFDEITGKFVVELQRLPIFPTIIAAVFWVVGQEDYLALGLVQCVMFGMIVVGMGLMARAVKREWMWPTVFFTAGWPILLWRTSIILPRITMLLFMVWGFTTLVWAAKARKTSVLLALAGVCFGALMLTHAHATLVPILLFPATILMLRKITALTWAKASAMALIPILVILVMMAPQVAKVYHYTDRLGYGQQAGTHTLEWLYPCLGTRWGCGMPDRAVSLHGKQALKSSLDAMTPEQRNNSQVVSDMMQNLAWKLILDLPPSTVVTSIIGSTVKTLLHPFSVEVVERFKLTRIHLSDIVADNVLSRVINYLKEASGSAATLFWLVSQILLLGSRGVQLLGTGAIIRDKAVFWHLAPLFLVTLSFPLLSIGFGNPRYRVPMEPAFIIMTVVGYEAVLAWWRARVEKWVTP